MNRKAFHQLLQRYVEGKCSVEEKRIIDQWYELLDMENQFELTDEEMDVIEERLWTGIKTKSLLNNATTTAKVFPFRRVRKWVAAASILLIAGAFYWFAEIKNTESVSIVEKKIHEGFLQYANISDTIKDITLEDKSIVSLRPHSKIALPAHFEVNKREVYLEGEAFFKVSKNASRPFSVYNNNVVTEVLGTSFDVKETNGKTEVFVRTGRVAVYENSDQVNLNNEQKKTNGVIITPNQKVTYYTNDRHFITSLVDDPIPIIQDDIAVQKISFVFDDTPLYKVIKALEKQYGLEIVVSDESLNNRPFTGDITKQDLYNKLELICQAIQATYEIKGTHILIKSK
jgi:transmembrane sensor